MPRLQRLAVRSILTFLLILTVSQARAALTITVTYPASAFAGPFTGRVVVFLSERMPQPRFGPNWFRPEPMYAKLFTNVKPGEPMRIDDTAVGFPGKLSALKPGDYTIQAVLDRNLGGRTIAGSPGNLYSEPVKASLDPSDDKSVALDCTNVVKERAFEETDTVKLVHLESKLLTSFYGRPTYVNAAVALPAEWLKEPDRKFPVIYDVPGFGGNHFMLSGASDVASTRRNGTPFLFVILDPDCPTGHSVCADSANNGPRGKALTTELIPEIEKRFRGIGTPESRFVTGHSSGGWSSLWLQVAYLDFFGGCWSTSPDPVDFRDFQQIDLYAPGTNMFTDGAGKSRPLARSGEKPIIFYRQFSDMEKPLRGEQLGSFEGVFSPRGEDGQPRKLWNRETGAIDTAVAETWKKYDIGLILRTHWQELGPKLRGKLHVYMGDMDTFYLDGAVRLLQKDLKSLGSDAVVEIVPGDHGSMMTPELRRRIDREMSEQFAHPPASGIR